MTVKIKHLWLMAVFCASSDVLSVLVGWTSFPRERLGGAVSVLMFGALVHFLFWLFPREKA